MSNLLLLSSSGAKKTELLYRGNLSYAQLNRYLVFLLEHDILKEVNVGENGKVSMLYEPTEKGFMLLEDINKVLSHFNP
jgi:predicted transcriptional regulator